MKFRNNIGKPVMSIIISVLCLSMIMGMAAAVEMPDLSRTGSVSVTMKSTETGAIVPGGELSVYKVADVEVDNGFVFVYTDDFSAYDTAITEDTNLNGDLAKSFAEIAQDKTPLATVKVGDDGVAKFDGLELGLYLVVQKTAADGYTIIDPFLVTIPYKNGDSYEYDVDATPKAGTATKEPDKPDKPDKPNEPNLPQTGQLWWPVPILVFAGVILVIAGVARKRKNEAKD